MPNFKTQKILNLNVGKYLRINSVNYQKIDKADLLNLKVSIHQKIA